jgi:hypothetical protein
MIAIMIHVMAMIAVIIMRIDGGGDDGNNVIDDDEMMMVMIMMIMNLCPHLHLVKHHLLSFCSTSGYYPLASRIAPDIHDTCCDFSS